MQILIGCDPELWVKDQKTGEIVSAHTFLPGTKLEPYKVPRGALQVDGTAAEFNIDPAKDHVEFVTNIKQVLTELKSRSVGYDLVFDPTVIFNPAYFNSLPDSVRELGCNPDFSAWTGQVNPAPDGESTTMRTASGHIHIGWCSGVNAMDPYHFEDCQDVIKELDYFIGLYSLLWDPDDQRRKLYGKAGAFRPKPYGAEYRTLSNVWLRSPKIQSWIFNAAYTAVNRLLDNQSVAKKFGTFAQDCIDGNVLDWLNTPTGNRVHMSTGLSQPDYKTCTEFYKTKTIDKPLSTEVKMSTKAKALYGTSSKDRYMANLEAYTYDLAKKVS